jgi:hypothetical protein
MKNTVLSLAVVVSLLTTLTIPNFAFGLFAAGSPSTDDWIIKGIYSNSPGSGFAFTRGKLFASRDDGKTWQQLDLPLGASEEIAGVTAKDDRIVALIADPSASGLIVAASTDGRNFSKTALSAAPGVLDQAELSNAKLTANADGTFNIELRLTTSSNFVGKLLITAALDGTTSVINRSVELNNDNVVEPVTSGEWTLTSEGTCAGYKAGCMQESRIVSNGHDITPTQVKQAAAAEKARLQVEVQNSQLLSPGGSTRVSLNRGFDMCNAPTAAQMQTWWNTSPHYDMNIYMSGRNRACRTQPNLSAAWVDQVTSMGWGLIPTIVGYQSPCTASTTTVKLDYNPTTAEQQGRGEADIAVADAANLGLTAGTILYYDMERYDETASTPGCRAATTAFLKGWTDRLKELGYKSGTYGSPKNAQEDWVTLPAASKMDAIWMARWDNVPSVWTYASFPSFPTNEWTNHQRIKQWQAPHNETWGGVTFNIDGNISDSLVAGPAIARNKNADFDGDGKTDISVFRPDSGIWYLLYSSNSAFTGIQFGNGTDTLAPADFDGDGKTDTSVFRPSDGTWHVLTKAGFYSVRQFGATGDIPVAADYNGDGKADTAVWRPSNGVWYIANSDSQGTYTFIQFGTDGDKPVPADYDRDGRTDPAVYRPATGVWYVLRSSDGSFTATSFGLPADLPSQGDYDGDGKCDFAIYRDGVWYLMQSTAGFAAFQFGVAGDVPSTGDYDGDGKADPAIFRPSAGAWYVLRSTGGVTAIGFGLQGDRSIPAAYLPQ